MISSGNIVAMLFGMFVTAGGLRVEEVALAWRRTRMHVHHPRLPTPCFHSLLHVTATINPPLIATKILYPNGQSPRLSLYTGQQPPCRSLADCALLSAYRVRSGGCTRELCRRTA